MDGYCGAFYHFEEALLYAFAGDVAAVRHDGGLCEFVDFVEEDDACFAFLDGVLGGEEETLDA